MRQTLNWASSNRFVGCAVGTLVTSVIQSSNATTVMLVGFVDAGLLTLVQAKAEIVRMGGGVQIMYQEAIYSLKERRLKELIRWRKRENALDILQREITEFLVKVAQKPISPEESREAASLLRITNNHERIDDAIENVAELTEELIEQDLHLSEGGLKDYENISLEAGNFIDLVVTVIKRGGEEVMIRA